MYAYLPVAPPPGLMRNATEYGSRGRWWDANLIRWDGNDVVPIQGWRQHSDDYVLGAARASMGWRDSDDVRHMGIGTHTHLYARSAAGNNTDITPADFVAGSIDGGAKTGFGQGPYGTGAFGVARPDTGDLDDATIWDLDNYGEQLYACARQDGRLLAWDLNTANDAAPVTNAPTEIRGFVVTEQRAVMVFGQGGNPRNAAWSDLENSTDWTPTAENQAGDFDIATQGNIMKGLRMGPQILILTTVDAHVAKYIRPPFVYGFEKVGHGCGLIGRGAAVVAGQKAFWWGRAGFWMYDGGQVTPLPCDLDHFLLSDLNKSQRSKIVGVHNSRFGEVWFFYPSASSAEIDSYISYSYRTGVWNKGTLARASGFEEGAFNYLIMVSVEEIVGGADDGVTGGYVYEHERGWDWDGATPFAETGPIELPPEMGGPSRVMKVHGVVGDEATAGEVELGFRTRMFPNAPETTIANVALTTRGESDLRFTARLCRMRVEGVANESWRFGTAMLKLSAGGGR